LYIVLGSREIAAVLSKTPFEKKCMKSKLKRFKQFCIVF
jgi:hypothetical protein